MYIKFVNRLIGELVNIKSNNSYITYGVEAIYNENESV